MLQLLLVKVMVCMGLCVLDWEREQFLFVSLLTLIMARVHVFEYFSLCLLESSAWFLCKRECTATISFNLYQSVSIFFWQVDVVQDAAVFEKEYPLMAAVNRAAKGKSLWTERKVSHCQMKDGSVTLHTTCELKEGLVANHCKLKGLNQINVNWMKGGQR